MAGVAPSLDESVLQQSHELDEELATSESSATVQATAPAGGLPWAANLPHSNRDLPRQRPGRDGSREAKARDRLCALPKDPVFNVVGAPEYSLLALEECDSVPSVHMAF